MRVTLLGHASVLIEMDGATCLMDPVLHDPFEEGTVVSCPARRVDPDRLPPLDVLVVSHRHPDHFDLESLDRLPRDVQAVCPGDPVIVHALRGLGFAEVQPVVPMAPILGPGFELYPTRSELASIPEMGMVFRDRSGVFWNQVDTLLSNATIDAVRERFGTIDLLFAMYASQNFEFFESRAVGFPTETHRRNLETAVRIAPRVAVPASAGFRFAGQHEWLNAFLFPISRERFVTDLAELEPRVDTRIVDPGDVLDIDGGEVSNHRAASLVARTKARDTHRLAFDPTAPVPALTDANPDGYEPARLGELAAGVLRDLARWLQGPAAAADRVVREYRRRRVRYRIGLVFPDGVERRFDLDFAAEPRAGEGATDLCKVEGDAQAPEADLVHRIAASALAGWAERRRSFFSVRASSRRFGSIYSLGRAGTGVVLEPRTPPDLLMYYLTYVAEGSERAALTEVDLRLDTLRTEPEGGPPPGARREAVAQAGATSTPEAQETQQEPGPAIEYDPRTALVIVDVQNDFADPGGNLSVRGGEEVVAVANREARRAREAGAPVVYTRDWHPDETPHFQAFGGKWPVHCVRDTWGAAFHPALEVEGEIVSKATGPEDGYSGFSVQHLPSGELRTTGLEERLRAAGVTRVVILGLATDYCVRETALDAARLGFDTIVLREGVRAVDLEPGDGDRALCELQGAGVSVV